MTNQTLVTQETQRIELDSPITMGDTTIDVLEIRKPNVQALQGVKIADLLQGDVSAICAVLPKISTPTITKSQVLQLDPADIAQIGGSLMLFLQPKSVRAELLQTQ